MKTLSTYRSVPAAQLESATLDLYTHSADLTTWNYEPSTGLLLSKRDAKNQEATYTYTPDGKLLTRTWARGVVTTYGYDSANRLTATDYSDTTPDVAITYDRLGRPISQSNGLATSSFSYDPLTLLLDTETLSYNFNGDATPDLVRVLDRSQDSLSRSSGYQLKNVSTIEATASYQYSPTTGRLESVGNGTDTFTYAYTTNSNLLASVTKSGTPTIQITHTWEPNRNVLDVKENKVGSTVISSYNYSVNDLGQRTAVDTAGSAFAAGERDRTWSYDALGQVTAEIDANNTAYHRGFAYDAIGNRLSSIEGNTDPTQPGATTYTPTVLNQYTQISAPSVPSVVPTYDADGNQLASQIRPLGTSSLASCLFVWDGENRLIEIKDATGTNSLAKYTYDSQSRRIARTVGGTTLATIYDGWNPIAEYQSTTTPATAFTLHATYLWGLDLSGSMQGAGGVGGLLSVTSGSTSFYPTYDGNGNVSEYLDAAGATVAHYEYDAFGNIIFSSGASASSFRHRFSTKPQDAESGLYYYGYRYYDPLTGRWPSRDPIEESGGVNLYGFVGNDGINWVDFLGRDAVVVSGGVNKNLMTDPEHDKNWKNFITSAELYIALLKGRLKEGEEIEWHVQKRSYTVRALNDNPPGVDGFTGLGDIYVSDIEILASKMGVKLVWYNGSSELVSNINKGDSEGDVREGSDQISDFSYFGHGNAEGWFVEGMEGGSGPLLKKSEFKKFLGGSFVVGCRSVSYSCNSGTPDAKGECVTDAWEAAVGHKMYGIEGKVDYAPVAVSKKAVAVWWFNRKGPKPAASMPVPGNKNDGVTPAHWNENGPPPAP